MRSIFNRFDIRISLLYFLAASLWIIASDTLIVKLLANNPRLFESLNTFKGLGFVVVTTGLLYFLLRRELLLRLDKETALKSEIQRVRSYQTELENSEMRFRKAVEEAPLPSIIFAEDGEVLSISQTWLDITGYTRKQLKTLDSWTERAYGERKQAVRAVIDRVFELTSRVDEGEFTIRCADGTPRIWAFSSTPLGRSSDGRRVAISIATDMTVFHQNAQMLHESQERYRLLVEQSPYAIGVHQDGGMVFANSSAARLLGATTPDELVGMSISSIVHPETWEAVQERIGRMLQGEAGLYPTEDRYVRLDGSIVDVEVTAAPFVYHGKPAVQVIALDITRRKRVEKEMRENAAMLRLFIEQAPAALAMFDHEMRYLAVSRRWMTDYRLNERDIIGQSHYEVFPEIPDHWKAVHRLGLEGKAQQAEADPFTRADGSIQWLHWKVYPWYTGEGTVGGIVIFTEDITERKQVQDALRESEQRFSHIFHASPVATVLTHLPDGRFVDVNEAMEMMTGYSRAELQGRTSLELGLYVSPDARAQLAEMMQRSGSYKNIDAQLKDKAGAIHDLLLSSELIELGSEKYVVTMAHDVTERKLAEAALRESEERYRLLINSLTDYAVFTMDAEGYITGWNNGAEHIMGYRADEIIGAHFSVFYNADDAAAGRPAQVLKLAVEQGSFRDEEWRVRKDGSWFWAEVYIVCIRDETGQLRGFSRVTRDLTERKQAEEHIRYQANLIESVSDAIISTDPEFVIQSWNKAAEGLYGWSAAEVIGKPLNEIVPTRYPDNNDAEVLAQFRSAGVWRGEVIQLHRDGTPIDILSSVSLALDSSGTPVGAVGINRDIRERKRAEEALQRYNQRLIALRQIDSDIIQARSPEAITEKVLRHIRRLIPCERASVILFEELEGTAVIFSMNAADTSTFQPQMRVPFIRNRNVEVLEAGQVLVIPDLQKHKDNTSDFARRALAEGIRATLSAPMQVEGKLVGHLSLAAKTPDFFTAEHSIIAGEIATQLAIAFYNARLLRAIQANNQQLQNLSARLVEAQEIERGHIARELHDEVGQTLTALSLLLSMPERQPDLQQAKLLLNDLTKRIRELSLDLRPSMLDDLGLIPTLIWYLERYQQQTGIIVDFKYSDVERRFASVIETTLYRIIQESLTNIVRHAQVDRASVRVWATSDMIHAQIEDTGKGFDLEAVRQTNKTGGLLGLSERAQLAGGICEIVSNTGEGTLISVNIPLEPVS